jgi:nicotinamide-nucleotide amidase
MTADNPELRKLSVRVGHALSKQQRTVATAESCTGGWIAKALTDIAGSSSWFTEGFVVYSNQAKVVRLGVPAALLRKYGAVSAATARAMASGALRRARTHVSVAVTGIAGPGGAVPGKPVGTVYICWARRRKRSIQIVVVRKQFRGDRDAVRRKTVRAALQGLLSA